MAEQLSLFNEEQLNNLEYIKDAEWCFQFFDNEPVVIGFSPDESSSGNLVLELKPTTQEILTFKQNGMQFRIFPREISEESKLLRKQQKEENASENKEAAQ